MGTTFSNWNTVVQDLNTRGNNPLRFFQARFNPNTHLFDGPSIIASDGDDSLASPYAKQQNSLNARAYSSTGFNSIETYTAPSGYVTRIVLIDSDGRKQFLTEKYVDTDRMLVLELPRNAAYQLCFPYDNTTGALKAVVLKPM